jgi:hypothetical protein
MGSLVIPSKHGVDGFGELFAARLVDTAGVYPEVLEAISGSLFPAESKFFVAFLVFPYAVPYFLKPHFLISPKVRQDGIARQMPAEELFEAELVIVIASQKAHSEDSGLGKQIDTAKPKKPK